MTMSIVRDTLKQQIATRQRWRYTLDADEVAHICEIASARLRIKVAHNVASKKFDTTKTDLSTHEIGVAGEYICASLLGLSLNDMVSARGNKTGFKLQHASGMTLDIKSRTKRGYDYALNSLDLAEFRADVGVLVWPGRTGDSAYTFELFGWISRERFARQCEASRFGYEPRLYVRNGLMAHPDKLAAHFDALERAALVWKRR